MKNKFEAVHETDPKTGEGGYAVKTKQGRMWHTVCDTYAADGKDAKENAERIAGLLNGETGLTLGQLSLAKSLVETILEDGDLRQGFCSVTGDTVGTINALHRALEKQIERKA